MSAPDYDAIVEAEEFAGGPMVIPPGADRSVVKEGPVTVTSRGDGSWNAECSECGAAAGTTAYVSGAEDDDDYFDDADGRFVEAHRDCHRFPGGITEWLAAAQSRADAATEGPWVAHADRYQDDELRDRDGAWIPGVANKGDDWDYGGGLLPLDPADAEFIAAARTRLPATIKALQAVLELHKPVRRYIVRGFEDISWGSLREAVESTECDPGDVTEWMQCAECARVEDGATGDGPAEVGYANADHPCPTVRAVADALGVEA